MNRRRISIFFFFFNDTATTEIYTLSLHDALPISCVALARDYSNRNRRGNWRYGPNMTLQRSEEHTSELQSQSNLVCRLLLEKKKMGRTLARNPKLLETDKLYGPYDYRYLYPL